MPIISSIALEKLAKENKISLDPLQATKLEQNLNNNLSKLVRLPISQDTKINMELRGEKIRCFDLESSNNKNDKLLANTQHPLKNQSITIQTSLKTEISSS